MIGGVVVRENQKRIGEAKSEKERKMERASVWD